MARRTEGEQKEIAPPMDGKLNFTTEPPLDTMQDRLSDSTAPGLLDLLLTLSEHKRLILLMTLAGALIAAAVSLIITPLYTAAAVILPPQQQQPTASLLLGQLGSIAGLSGGGLGLKNPADLYIGILNGRTIADNIIRAFDLQTLYRESTLTGARKALASRVSFSTGKETLIRISVEDRDAKRAAAIANAYVDELHKQTNHLALTESAQRRLFFESQLESQKKLLANAETAFAATQERTGAVQVTSQVESVIRALAQLRAEIMAREVAIAALKNGATVQNPEVVRQESELTELRGQLRTLEADKSAKTAGDTFISTSRAPRVGLEYIRALRDLKYNETLLELLAKQYELARIDEAKEAPVIQVVDSALPPDRKSWPPRAALTLSSAAGSGILACLLALGSHRVKDPREAEKLRRLTRQLLRKPHSTS